VIPPDQSFYARWRQRSGVVSRLRDDDTPTERLVQAVWQHQRLLRDQLVTTDGRRVRVLHPGFGNAEGGPDFRGALIQFDDNTPLTGDVEVDLRTSGWHSHGHDINPNFKNVILHVVWESGKTSGANPTLVVRQCLDAPLAELSLWLEREPGTALSESMLGKCSAPLRALPPEQLAALLGEAAQVRLQSKASQFQARARHAGWEQSLWEGLFRALGYKHNAWPMQALAETRARWMRGDESAFVMQARMLGICGLLPAELTRAQAAGDGYLRRAWDCWWRDRDEFADCILPNALWRFHGLRPANHPQRRLALAAHWLSSGGLPAKLERWCAVTVKDIALVPSLLGVLQVERDEFWSWHWTLRSPRLKKSQPLLGSTRVTDLAVNVILPWLWTRAVEGGNEKLRIEIERRYHTWPAAEDNSVLKLARQRLLGGAGRNIFRKAASQQGLIQIVRDFCGHANSICDGCGFPELVRNYSAQHKT